MFLIPFGRPVEEFAAASSRAEAGLGPADYAALDIGGRARDLVPATLGNVAGGVPVGAAYRFACLRPEREGAGG